jgi:pimeloyl-ACP methyl ester carboxylesterase
MKAVWICVFVIFPLVSSRAEDIQKFSFKPPQDMTRADVYALKTSWTPRAVLILCPGANGNGEGMICQRKWQEFAREQHLGLAGLSFASDESFLRDCGRGYYCAAQGSGQTLLDAIWKIYGRDMPLLLYGFSGGAHFTSAFVEWKPERVTSWCAYSAGWWDTPLKAAVNPPGIVACGDEDPRYGATMIYFKQGRAADKPWLWISVPGIGHATSPRQEAFIRDYFAAALKKPHPNGLWVDVDLETPTSESLRKEQPSLTGWLPDAKLFEEWKAINKP